MQRPDVLVLGAGGTLGEAWLRALLAGLEAGAGFDLRECDHFVGTSAGSIVATVLAAGRRPEAARAASEGWTAASAPAAGAGGFAPGGAGAAAAALAAPVATMAAAGLAPGRAVLRRAILARGRPGARTIPRLGGELERLGARFDGRLLVTAVDLGSGRRVVFGAPGAPAASVTQAVLASCAVPWVFEPVRIRDRSYVDGGAWSPANLDAAPVRRGTRVLCLNPTASPRLRTDRLGAMRAFATGTAAAEALLLRSRGAHVRIESPDAASIAAIGSNLFDARRRERVEAAGYAQGRALASTP
jgi:NTE family protein